MGIYKCDIGVTNWQHTHTHTGTGFRSENGKEEKRTEEVRLVTILPESHFCGLLVTTSDTPVYTRDVYIRNRGGGGRGGCGFRSVISVVIHT